MITMTIDKRQVQVENGMTVLEAARQQGINIPTLCYLKNINKIGACRMCLVEVKGARGLQTSCTTPCTEGMEVTTNSIAVRGARKLVLELLLSDHNMNCPTCVKVGNCELLKLSQEHGVSGIRFEGEKHHASCDCDSPSLAIDSSKCVLCQRCVSVCREVQGVSAISLVNRGFESAVTPFMQTSIDDAACALCGQCTLVCPTGALTEKDDTEQVWKALLDPTKHVIVQTAPATRVAIGEMFGMPHGTIATGQMVAAIRRLGFDRVFDTNFSADLTIMEEASELVQRLQNNGPLPLITSCSPGWVKYAEHFFPDQLDHLSSCKSPQQMFGAIAKTYYAEKMGIDPKDIVSVSIMPCTAKKFEAARDEMNSSGYQDVDYVITTRELGRMIKQAGLNLAKLPKEEYDVPLGIGTGAGQIFGTTGGVMEAAMRTAASWLGNNDVPRLQFTEVRGEVAGIKEATVVINGNVFFLAIVNGLAAAGKIMEKIRAGETRYHFVEIMGCPGGCIGGGGQPIPEEGPDALEEVRIARIKSMYSIDEAQTIRRSHENPAIQALYREFLGAPLSHKSHELLHTHYHHRAPVGVRRQAAALDHK
ncbi:MAG TPA: NADH-dependent [FeFe] hydrogenase, group A6 [Symbiobacteriaceae bacterium]|nr:NADH-dependent [FeFe] hydrogenase, group A6 [Symbiobacteriaceae bacterium]